MKFLQLSGLPFEIGVQHGEQAKDEVHFSLDSYERLFFDGVGMSWKDAVEQAKKYIDFIEQTDVTLLEEMDGIASGAAVDFHDILVLNARSEIALTIPNKIDGCTSLAVLPPLATNAYLAQNWDWRAAQARSLVIMNIEQTDRPTIQMVTEGGIIGKIGFNSAGLGVCLNAIRANVKSEKLPIHLGLRVVLNSTHIDEAVERVVNQTLASAANFLIAQDDGESQAKTINLELSPTGDDQKSTDDSYLYHTNHLCSEALVEKIGEKNLDTTKNTFVRLDRMKQLIDEQKASGQQVDGDVIHRWLSDHEHEPFSICRHKQPGTSDYTNTITVFAVIMNLTKRTMHFMNGQPCNPTMEKVLTL